MRNGLISVIVPVYNREQYIDKCLQSILNQTYTNLEVILVDDGSTDSSSEMCDKWQEKDSRVRVVHQKNGGLSNARNTGLKLSSAEYTAFVDADDIVHPQMYEALITLAKKYKLDMAVCKYKPTESMNIEFKIYDSTALLIESPEIFTGNQALNGFREYYQVRIRIPVWCKLYRTKLIKEIGFVEGRIHEDEFFIHHIVGACDRIGIINKVLYFYYQSPNSITRSKYNIKRTDIVFALRDRFLYFKARGIQSQINSWGRYYIHIALREWRIILSQHREYIEYYKNTCLKQLYEDRDEFTACRLSPILLMMIDCAYRFPTATNAFNYSAAARAYRKYIKNPIAKMRNKNYNNKKEKKQRRTLNLKSNLEQKNSASGQYSAASNLEYYMKEAPFAVKITGVKKEYRIGQIGRGTLRADFQSWIAKRRGEEDPNVKLANAGRYVGKDRFMALNGIDLEIKHGETIGLIGANGAGKSTLLKLLSRVTGPTEGKIEIYGRIASMLEVGTGFNGEFTGRENIYMNGAILGMTKEEVDRKMDAIIEFSEIGKHIDTPVKRYSSGMFVKLGFAVAVNLDAEIMIMDEVLAVGDMAFQKKCIDKMHGIEEENGKTIIYVSHNMDTIKRLCDRCIVLDQGKVAFDGPAAEAISLYMGINGAFSHHYDYPESCHSRMRTRKIVVETLDFPESFTGQLVENRKVSFSITARGKTDVDKAFFRIEVVNSYGNIVGISSSQKSVAIRRGEVTTVNIVMDSSHMAPGNYRVNIAAFTFSDLADKIEIDRVESAFTFETLYDDSVKGEANAHWFSDWNSNINLKPLEVSEG